MWSLARPTSTPPSKALADVGYKYLGDCSIPDRYAFEAPPHGPPRHVYVIVDGCLALRNHIGVRDVLRDDAQLRVEYWALKLDLATKEFDSIDDYVAAKSQLLQRALHEAGLEAGRSRHRRRRQSTTHQSQRRR
jgi:GrpB-like predicted nucleotidyltransferase (UPF0157 family)